MMAGTVDPIHHRSAKIWPSFREQIDPIGHGLSLRARQRRPPLDELVGDLDLPHLPSMNNYS